jgi:enoyl-CoA hydratase/carnithine racemase
MPSLSSDGGALVRRADRFGSAVLTLDSPANRNALSRALIADLRRHLADVAADEAVRALVITASGGTFCSGADLKDPPVQRGGGSFAELLQTLWDFPKPVVAAVNGHVRAGGLGLVAAADVVLCVETATFAFTEVRIGVVPAVIAVLCQRKMTAAAAARYFLTGESFDARAAVAAGLVSEVVAADSLTPALDRLLGELRRCEPEALRVTRDLMRRLPGLDVDDGFEQAAAVSEAMFASAAAAEGIAAFREKRVPEWAL